MQAAFLGEAFQRQSLDVFIFSLVGCCDITQERCRKKEITVCDQAKETNEAAQGTFFVNFLNLFEKQVNYGLEHLCASVEM